MSDQIRKSDEIERYLLNNERPPVVMHGNNYPTGRDINDFLHDFSSSNSSVDDKRGMGGFRRFIASCKEKLVSLGIFDRYTTTALSVISIGLSMSNSMILLANAIKRAGFYDIGFTVFWLFWIPTVASLIFAEVTKPKA